MFLPVGEGAGRARRWPWQPAVPAGRCPGRGRGPRRRRFARHGTSASSASPIPPSSSSLSQRRLESIFDGEGTEGEATATAAETAAADDATAAEDVAAKAVTTVDDLTEAEKEAAEEECDLAAGADPPALAAVYALGMLYTFLALAIVCDEFFVPALEEMASEDHMNLSMDVAGATLMAAGGSAPELFTSFVGTFRGSDIGIGTIVGSAVFNVLFVIGMCSIFSKEVLALTWWPLFRDCAYYAVSLAILTVLVGVVTPGEVVWWEAVVLLGLYVGYVLLMYFNRKLYKRITGKELVLPGEEEEAAAEDGEGAEEGGGGAANENGAAKENGVADENGAAKEHHRPNERGRWPGTFRAGILKLLLNPESLERKGGIGIVAKMTGDVEHVFKEIDVNGDGQIDKEELGTLFSKLGHDLTDDEVAAVLTRLDLDGNGTVSACRSPADGCPLERGRSRTSSSRLLFWTKHVLSQVVGLGL